MSLQSEQQQQHIKKLPQCIIDKIAAGEVIQRPSSAAKELIENSLDSKSTEITITLLQGGLKQLIIEDNGSGINVDDFPLLCERFATSKITDFNDLQALASFGFRGEALASISFVSYLKITSRQSQLEIGYSAQFKNGLMIDKEPVPVSCPVGTTVEVNELFHNLDIRKNSLSANEERRKILKLIGQFATHHIGVGFRLKSDGVVLFSSNNILGNTPEKRRENVLQSLTKLSDKSFISIQQNSEEYKVKYAGTFSHINAAKKYKELTLFINNRLVESDPIKKALDRAYQACYQSIHEEEGGYFCYMSLEMNTMNLDPNVHPTKKEVKFLFEIEISRELEVWIFNVLKESGVLKKLQADPVERLSIDTSRKSVKDKFDGQQQQEKQHNQQPQQQQCKQVRVDPKQQKITRHFSMSVSQNNIQARAETTDKLDLEEEPDKQGGDNENIDSSERNKVRDMLLNRRNKLNDEETTQFFKQLSFLSSISSNHFLAQFQDDLYLINSILVCEQLFVYEIMNTFGRSVTNQLIQPIDISLMIRSFLKSTDKIPLQRKQYHLSKVDSYLQEFSELSDFMRDSVGITIVNNELIAFPNPFGVFTESHQDEIAYTLLRIISKVSFDSVIESVEGLAQELANHFAWKMEVPFEKRISDKVEQNKWNGFFEYQLLQTVKSGRANLPQLDIQSFAVKLFRQEDAYKIFERC